MPKADEDVTYRFAENQAGGFVRTDRRASVLVKHQKTRAAKRGEGFQYQSGVSDLSLPLLLLRVVVARGQSPALPAPPGAMPNHAARFAFSLTRSQLESVHQSTASLQS